MLEHKTAKLDWAGSMGWKEQWSRAQEVVAEIRNLDFRLYPEHRLSSPLYIKSEVGFYCHNVYETVCCSGVV